MNKYCFYLAKSDVTQFLRNSRNCGNKEAPALLLINCWHIFPQFLFDPTRTEAGILGSPASWSVLLYVGFWPEDEMDKLVDLSAAVFPPKPPEHRWADVWLKRLTNKGSNKVQTSQFPYFFSLGCLASRGKAAAGLPARAGNNWEEIRLKLRCSTWGLLIQLCSRVDRIQHAILQLLEKERKKIMRLWKQPHVQADEKQEKPDSSYGGSAVCTPRPPTPTSPSHPRPTELMTNTCLRSSVRPRHSDNLSKCDSWEERRRENILLDLNTPSICCSKTRPLHCSRRNAKEFLQAFLVVLFYLIAKNMTWKIHT